LVAFERDVTSFIDRMEQAATDVLMNKAIWSDGSLARRQVWDPTTATLSPQSGLRLTQDKPYLVSCDSAIDCFNA